jgi:hypothetical protein
VGRLVRRHWKGLAKQPGRSSLEDGRFDHAIRHSVLVREPEYVVTQSFELTVFDALPSDGRVGDRRSEIGHTAGDFN